MRPNEPEKRALERIHREGPFHLMENGGLDPLAFTTPALRDAANRIVNEYDWFIDSIAEYIQVLENAADKWEVACREAAEPKSVVAKPLTGLA